MRIALPKGRLLDGVIKALQSVGVEFHQLNPRNYRPECNWPNFSAKMIKPKAVCQGIAMGNFDLGFCGLDLITEAGYEMAVPILNLGLNPVKLVVAVPPCFTNIVINPPSRPIVIATEYSNIASRWAYARNLAHVIYYTGGSTEVFPPEDADMVFDCVESERTMKANNLIIIDRIMDSATWVVVNKLAWERGDQDLHNLVTALKDATED
ncbi:TPA: ATP phosphoribosyltransferase [Candidatus Falkowbacteria bacterium]|nr:ATP phosphoribosyltransferase [Candidatus Falkowbacteria bacterium]